MAVDENGATMPLPVGDMKLEEFGIWQSASMRLKLFLALPWQRCKGNSVLSFNVRTSCGVCFLSSSCADCCLVYLSLLHLLTEYQDSLLGS